MDIGLATAGTLSPGARRATRVAWREVALFGLLACGLSWLCWGWWLYPHLGRLLTATATPSDFPALVGGQLGVAVGGFGPLVAAAIMRLFASGEGVGGSLGWRRPWKYYLIALLAPPACLTALAVVNHLTGVGRFAWPGTGRMLATYPLLLIVAAIYVPFTLGEEYGWRGYLLPRLLPLGEVRASALVGLLWAVWHLPLLLAGLNYPGRNPWLALLVEIVATIGIAFPFTWLYVASGGSVLVAAVLHASLNAYADTLIGTRIPQANPLLVCLLMGIVLLGSASIVYLSGKRSPMAPVRAAPARA